MVVMFKRLVCILLLLASFGTAAACDWPAWQQFKQHYISEAGRVIDPSNPRKVTTSEGQSYGLFLHWWQMIARHSIDYSPGRKTICRREI